MKNVHPREHLPARGLTRMSVFNTLHLEHKFKRISVSFGCEFIYQATQEPCTKRKLEQVSSELWSLMDVQCYYTYRAFGQEMCGQDVEFCGAE